MNGSARLEVLFPKLSSTPYRITSPAAADYNCIAWAADEDDRWWWPDPMGVAYWPEDAPREETLDALIQAFHALGYEPCESDQVEHGFLKVAIYVDHNGIPTHAARQLEDGRWTSKLGQLEDIEHSLDALTGSHYGTVGQVLRRPIH